MGTLLWLAIGVLLGILAWLLPSGIVIVPLVVAAFTLVAVLLPRDVTSVAAKVGIGFGATFLVIVAPNVFRDPLAANGATYLLFGSGLLIMLAGLAGVWRTRRRRQRALQAAADLL
jgi:hypothetical protein